MNLPSLTSAASLLADAQPYLIGCAATLIVVLFAVTVIRITKPRRSNTAKQPGRLENRLTFLVAIVAAGVAAQGMWRFFRDVLDFPPEIRIVAFAVLELVTFTCALRARRNIREAKTPDQARAGIDGIAVWVVTALSGAFSAMDAESLAEALFRLLMPLLAAWLWERGMSIERQRVRGGSTIHWRVTPERLLVALRLAEPSGRTASEIDTHRRLTKVAKASARVRSVRGSALDVKGVRLSFAQRRLDRAMRAAVAHAGLAQDSDKQRALIAQLGSMYNARALADLTPDAPWDVPKSLTQATGLESGQVTSEATTQVTSTELTQATPQVTRHATTEVTPPRTPHVTSQATTKPGGATDTKSRRTDDELKAELEQIVAAHYRDNPGAEIKVQPIARQLGIGRDRARTLLAEMNVRPIRKAVNQ